MAVDVRYGRVLANDLGARRRVEIAVIDLPDVLRYADEAVRIMAGQIGVGQMPRHHAGVMLGRAGRAQDLARDSLDRLVSQGRHSCSFR